MSQQGYRQASIRAVTGSTETYDGDWVRLFDAAGIPDGMFNERMLAWVNLKLSKAYSDMAEALQALADVNGAFNFSSLGTFSAATGGGTTPNAQLVLNAPEKTGFTFMIGLY